MISKLYRILKDDKGSWEIKQERSGEHNFMHAKTRRK